MKSHGKQHKINENPASQKHNFYQERLVPLPMQQQKDHQGSQGYSRLDN